MRLLSGSVGAVCASVGKPCVACARRDRVVTTLLLNEVPKKYEIWNEVSEMFSEMLPEMRPENLMLC